MRKTCTFEEMKSTCETIFGFYQRKFKVDCDIGFRYDWRNWAEYCPSTNQINIYFCEGISDLDWYCSALLHELRHYGQLIKIRDKSITYYNGSKEFCFLVERDAEKFSYEESFRFKNLFRHKSFNFDKYISNHIKLRPKKAEYITHAKLAIETANKFFK